jgi:hypothetical protein
MEEEQQSMDSDARILELEAKVAELSAVVDRIASHDDAKLTASVPMPPATSSRRNMLKLAGAAAVGTVAATMVGVGQAAATNGINIADPTLPVRNDYTGNVGQVAFLFQAGNEFSNGDAAFDCALAGWSSDGGDNLPHGVYGFTNNGGFGVVASGGTNSSGLLARGSRSNLEIRAEGVAGPVRTDAHALGEIINDGDGNLWVNVAAGTPGSWVRLAGPSTSGSLQLLATPTRVYDSRVNTLPAVDPKTPLTNLVSRTIDCKANSSGVPAGARGVLLNVTVVSVSASGFLAVTPGGAGFTGTSTLNWSAAGAVIANSATSACGTGATIDVTCGGGGTTDVIVDVFGYYL